MKEITKKQYEDIWFNPDISITEKSIAFKGVYSTYLYNGLTIIAKRVIDASGVFYYAI